MHKRAVRTMLRASSARVTPTRAISTLMESKIRQLRPFDVPSVSQSQPPPRKGRNTDPESLNYYETRQLRYMVPRKRINKSVYASITKALYSKEINIDDIYNLYLNLPTPRPLHLQHAELEQLLDLIISPALRDKHTIKRLLTISEDMRECKIPLSIKEVNTLVYLVLRDKNWQTQYNPAKPAPPSSADMEYMMQLLSGNVEWPVSTFNIALVICKGDNKAFQELLDKMEQKGVQWDATTVQTVFRQRLRAGEDTLETFYSLYSGRDTGPQDVNILIWGLLRSGEGGYDKAVAVISHLAQFSTSEINNAVRQNKSAFKAAKFERKTARKKNAKTTTYKHMSSIGDIPPTTMTPETFSMLLHHHKSFSECTRVLKMAQMYFGEVPTMCLQDMYQGFEKHETWTGDDLIYLTEYVLKTKPDNAIFTLELFMAALKAYKATGVIDARGGTALISEANCLEAVRLARTDEEKQAYIFIYFRRLHVQKHQGLGGGELKPPISMVQEWMDVFLDKSRYAREMAAPKEMQEEKVEQPTRTAWSKLEEEDFYIEAEMETRVEEDLQIGDESTKDANESTK